jgi:ethanolamine utilization protein EutL
LYGIEPVRARVPAVKIIPNVNEYMRKEFKLEPGYNSIGMITVSIDDVGFTAVDEATKKANVEVVYARSFYAGNAHASGPLSGEFIGILAGPDPAEVESGIKSALECIRNDACFYTADEKGEIAFFAHCISRTGKYLSRENNIKEGQPLAYLIAPPIEAMFALDAAIKAADVRMTTFFGPPSETNFAGAQLTGDQSNCRAACEAFARAIMEVAQNPVDIRIDQ